MRYQDQLNPVATVDASGNVLQRFVYGTRINVPDYMVASGTTYRIVSDHLGSVRLVVDASTGVVAQRLDYDEFGNVTLDTSPGFQPFGFAGGLYDADTGLVRFGARDYDSATGRWTRKDPAVFAGGQPNLYEYIGNNPVRSIDVDGSRPVGNPNAGTSLGAAATNPLGAIIVLAGIAASAVAADHACKMSKGGTKNLENEYSRMAKHLMRPPYDPCDFLDWLHSVTHDKEQRQKIRTAQKYLGCSGRR